MGAGAVCGDADFIRSLVDLQVGPIMLTGPTMDAKVASELSLRLAHLGIRMAEHSRRAAAYAERLQQVMSILCCLFVMSSVKQMRPEHSARARALQTPQPAFMAHLGIRMAWHFCCAAAYAECLLQVLLIFSCPQCDMRALAGIIIAYIEMRQTWASCFCHAFKPQHLG